MVAKTGVVKIDPSMEYLEVFIEEEKNYQLDIQFEDFADYQKDMPRHIKKKLPSDNLPYDEIYDRIRKAKEFFSKCRDRIDIPERNLHWPMFNHILKNLIRASSKAAQEERRRGKSERSRELKKTREKINFFNDNVKEEDRIIFIVPEGQRGTNPINVYKMQLLDFLIYARRSTLYTTPFIQENTALNFLAGLLIRLGLDTRSRGKIVESLRPVFTKYERNSTLPNLPLKTLLWTPVKKEGWSPVEKEGLTPKNLYSRVRPKRDE